MAVDASYLLSTNHLLISPFLPVFFREKVRQIHLLKLENQETILLISVSKLNLEIAINWLVNN